MQQDLNSIQFSTVNIALIEHSYVGEQQVSLSALRAGALCEASASASRDVVSSNETLHGFHLLWDNGHADASAQSLRFGALGFHANAGGSATLSFDTRAVRDAPARDTHRGCYCVRFYNEEVQHFHCAMLLFPGDRMRLSALCEWGDEHVLQTHNSFNSNTCVVGLQLVWLLLGLAVVATCILLLVIVLVVVVCPRITRIRSNHHAN